MFKREVDVWSKLKHINVLPLMGYAFVERDGLQYPLLVSEWMGGGSAWQFVNTAPDKKISRVLELVRFICV